MIAIAIGLLPLSGFAHGDADLSQTWTQWSFDPGLVVALWLAIALYWSGWRNLRRANPSTRRSLRRAVGCYVAGWIALVVALVSPLHPWGQILFSAHMTQHEILMLVAAPCLVLGRPVVMMLWALPRSWTHAAARIFAYSPARAAGRVLEQPLVAWVGHAVALWIWHIPALFAATLASEPVHHLQHASFFFSALWFWQTILRGPQRIRGYGVGVLYLFTTAIHSGALGALITFAGTVWYPHYLSTTGAAGWDPLEDQQLGGLIMWIPAGLVYVGAALLLAYRWLAPEKSTLPVRTRGGCASKVAAAGVQRNSRGAVRRDSVSSADAPVARN